MRAFLVALLISSGAFAQEALLLVRHAEKVDNAKDALLSPAGHARAEALAVKLRDAGITAVFATDVERTQQTAAPLAAALHLEVTRHAASDTAGLVKLLRKSKRALVVGHSNTLPEIAQAYGVKLSLADDEYDALFVLIPRTKTLIKLRQ